MLYLEQWPVILHTVPATSCHSSGAEVPYLKTSICVPFSSYSDWAKEAGGTLLLEHFSFFSSISGT